MIFLKEIITPSTITPKDIYNFYYLFSVSSYHPQVLNGEFGSYIQNIYIKAFKNKYITVFKKLIVAQLQKYYSQKRIDVDFDISKIKEISSANELLNQMKKTYRSDMSRRNTVWEQTCEFLVKLEQSSSIKETYLYIDRLNSMLHNTNTSILGKIDYQLVAAYNKVHNAKSLNDYKQYVDKDIRELL